MNALRRHPGLRRALLTAGQLLSAGVLYSLAVILWHALGGRGTPGVVTVLAVTVVVAAVLSVSRRHLERLVNWLAFGERADGYELASGFLRQLETAIDLDDVLPRLAETAARTVGGHRGEVRVWLADGGSWRQTWPLDATLDESDVTVQVRHAGDPVGEMVVSVPAHDLSPADRRLLGDLAGPAGVALSTFRLTHALRQQAQEIERTAAEIQESQRRIIDARRVEQSRIRKLLETRVQPHIDAARAELCSANGAETDAWAAASAHVSEALDELRTVARGLFPARLAEAGAVGALRSWMEERPGFRFLSVSGDPRRLEDQAELAAALYFCVMTGLPGASRDGCVDLAVGDEDVVLEVSAGDRQVDSLDAEAQQALVDRTEAFGGEVTVDESRVPPLVRIRIPVAAGVS